MKSSAERTSDRRECHFSRRKRAALEAGYDLPLRRNVASVSSATDAIRASMVRCSTSAAAGSSADAERGFATASNATRAVRMIRRVCSRLRRRVLLQCLVGQRSLDAEIAERGGDAAHGLGQGRVLLLELPGRLPEPVEERAVLCAQLDVLAEQLADLAEHVGQSLPRALVDRLAALELALQLLEGLPQSRLRHAASSHDNIPGAAPARVASGRGGVPERRGGPGATGPTPGALG